MNSDSVALSLLLHRLKWPVPMTRWRAAKQIRNLLDNSSSRSSTMTALLDYLEKCQTESEVCEILTIILLTSPAARPLRSAVLSRIHCPSILANVILERIYKVNGDLISWKKSHSGTAPHDFKATSYFDEYKTAHAPPLILHQLRELEEISGMPFLRQWAFEWNTIRNKLDIRCTHYPYYFEDGSSDLRSGIVGQYWQRMRDVYISAYLRTLACAVNEWGMPRKVALDYCIRFVPGISGLFELEPCARPACLEDIPEKYSDPETDSISLIHRLIQSARVDGKRLVSLDAPLALSVNEFARFRLSAHLVSQDYEPPDSDELSEIALNFPIQGTFSFSGSLKGISLEKALEEGQKGDSLAVCNTIFPVPSGTWHGDYFYMGVRVLAPCIFPGIEISCTSESINCLDADGGVLAESRIWHDNWTPAHPKGSSTRCGISTMVNQEILDRALEALDRKLAFFVQLQTWSRESDYGPYQESQASIFLLESSS